MSNDEVFGGKNGHLWPESHKIIFTSKSPKDWSEDFPHENGCYINRCIECKEQFMGHKRRVICKECYHNQIVIS